MRIGAFAIHYVVASIILITIVAGAYIATGIMKTDIMLGGWDTPFYAWHAKIAIQYGPLYLMRLQSYSNLYTELLALIGFISGSVVLTQRILPIVLGMLTILFFMATSYKISKSVKVAGLTAILTPLTVGTLHLISEYHRNQMAYLLGLSTFLLLAPKSSGTVSNRRYIIFFLLSLASATTGFETFALFSLTLILVAIIVKDWKRLMFLLLSSLLVTGILLLVFPNFLDVYYFHIAQKSVSAKTNLSFEYVVFWTIGSWILLPVAFLGLVNLYHAARRKETKSVSLPVFVLFTVLLLTSIILIVTGDTELNRLAGRGILLLPIPIILALGIEPMAKVVRRLVKKIKQEKTNQCTLTSKDEERKGSKIAILLSVMMIMNLAYTSYEALKIIMVPFVRVSGYSKIVAVRQYLQNYPEAPIFMFNGSSFWNSDLYRAYIGIEIGEHLAYFGDLENLIELRPTGFQFSSTPGGVYAEQLANSTSVRYLEDMLGDKKYLIYPQKAFVRNVSDLRLHPLVYIAPELWDAPVPSHVKEFKVADDIYVVPSLAEIESKVLMEIP
jgi:hypothetical protein